MRRAPLQHLRLLSLGTVANRLEVLIKTVRRWIGRGELRAHDLGRQIVRVSEEDLMAFVNHRRR